MEDRVCIVTGGTSGVGKSIAVALAKEGAKVILVARNREKGHSVAEEIRHQTANEKVLFESVDLSSLESIRRFVDKFKRDHVTLHVLSNNAAVLPMKKTFTKDGLEQVFSVNYLSHFLLTNLLIPLLESSAPSRVLTVSGGPLIVRQGHPRLDDIQMSRFYNPFIATLRAAAMKVAFSYELAHRLEGTGVRSNTFHPGLVKSDLARNFPEPMRSMIHWGESLFFSASSKTGDYLATTREAEGLTGKFFVNTKPIDFHPKWMSKAFLNNLWALSETLSGLS